MKAFNQPAGNPDSDKLVMLMSADWSESFLPYLGIEVLPEHQPALRAAARTAVAHAIGREDSYFSIDFSAKRIAETRSTFFSEARRRVPVSLLNALSTRFDAVLAPSKDEEGTVAILLDAAWSLAKGESTLFPTRPAVSASTLQVAAASWRQCDEWYEKLFPEADQACWQSATEWDTYLRSLSDLPSFLADYLCATVQTLGRMPMYWNLLVRRVDPAELDRLKHWFVEAAGLHAQPGLTVRFPSYMQVSLP
jgi:hypothetical protein